MKGFYIDELPDGSVRYRLSYKDPLTGKTKRLSCSMEHHSVRNQRKAEETLQKRLEGLFSPTGGDLLVSDAISRYLADMARSWRRSTYDRNAASLGRVLRLFPADSILQNITPQKWREILTDLTGDGTAGKYNEYLKRVKAFLRWCYFNDYLPAQIADKLTAKVDPDADTSRATDKVLEAAEVPVLLDALMTVDRWHQLARFMLLSGLRCGEALALNDADVDLEFVHVTKTLNANHMTVGAPKTPKSRRDVSVTDELAVLITEIKKYNQWLKVSLGVRSDLFFFSEDDGSFLHWSVFNKFLRENSERVLKKPITSHWLRHTHASFLLASGIPIDVISRRLGHENTEVTQRVYLHIIEKLKKRDADMLRSVKLFDNSPKVMDFEIEPAGLVRKEG